MSRCAAEHLVNMNSYELEHQPNWTFAAEPPPGFIQ